jgi:hypothetical protein
MPRSRAVPDGPPLTPTELRLEAEIVDPTQATAVEWWLTTTDALDLQEAFLIAVTLHLERGHTLAASLELAADAVERTPAWRDATPGGWPVRSRSYSAAPRRLAAAVRPLHAADLHARHAPR